MSTRDEIYEYEPLIADEGSESDFNVVEVLSTYLRHWKWFILSLLIAGCAGYFYVKTQIPVYKIQSMILIKDNSSSKDNDLLTQLNLNPSNIVIDNEIQILKSTTILERTVEALGLQVLYFSKENLSKRILYNNIAVRIKVLKPNLSTYGRDWDVQGISSNEVLFNGKKYSVNRPVSTEAGLLFFVPTKGSNTEKILVRFSTVEGAAQQFGSKLTITPVSKIGTALTITTEDAVPARGKDFLNILVNEYNKAGVEDKNETISNTLAFIEDRLKVLLVELGASEKDVVNYRSSNNIADLTSQSQLFLSTVANSDAEIAKIQLQLVTLENIEQYLKSSGGEQVKLPSLMGIEDPTLSSLVSQLGEAQIKKQSLLRTVPEAHPMVSSIDDQINSVKKSLGQTIGNVRSGLIASEKKIRQQSKRYESSIKQVPIKERGLMDVMRQQNIKNNLFNFLLQKREETALSLASTIPDSRIVNPAQSSSIPIKPVKSSLYLSFLLIGLFLPIIVIFIKESLNNRIRKSSQIEKLTKATVLGQVSRSDNEDVLISVSQPRSMVSEQIRGLRTNLEFIIPDKSGKVLLFTSSISGEGKSFLSLNLGASIASTDKKVIILELDLRKPKLLSTLGLTQGLGLSEYLIGKVEYSGIVQPVTLQPNFYLIESGAIPPNPAELLLNGRLDLLIEQLKREYDYIILDTPPVGLVTDAQILGRYADSTLFVVRYNFTMKDNIRLLNPLLKKNIFKRLNIIFNSIDVNSFSYNHYQYAYYQESTEKKESWWRKLVK